MARGTRRLNDNASSRAATVSSHPHAFPSSSPCSRLVIALQECSDAGHLVIVMCEGGTGSGALRRKWHGRSKNSEQSEERVQSGRAEPRSRRGNKHVAKLSPSDYLG